MHKIIIIQNELLHDNKDRNIDICTLKEFVIVNARGKQLITVSLCSMIFYRDEIISTKEFTLEFYVFLSIVKKLIKQHQCYVCIIKRHLTICHFITANNFEEIKIYNLNLYHDHLFKFSLCKTNIL